jgi:type III secretion protein W
MGIEIAGLQNSPLAGPAAEQTASAVAAQGVFMGAEVLVANSPASLLADAAEELTFSMSETQESKLDERKEKAGAEKKRARFAYIDAAREIARNADGKFNKALDNLERMCKARNQMELGELMRELGKALQEEGQAGKEPDPADRFTVLCALKEKLGEGHPLSGLMDAALEHLAEKDAAALSSGFSAALAAPGFGELGESSSLRSFYRDTVEDFTSPREALTSILARYGQGRLEQALDFLMRSLGNDLSFAKPSAETAKLKALTSDISAVRVLGAAHAASALMLERLDNIHGVQSPVTAEKLLDMILTLKDNKFAAAPDVRAILDVLKLPDTERNVLFLQDFSRGLRGLPDLFYAESETRLRTLDAAQEALDEAISREESEMGF